jgi:hypothetical protein
MRKTNCVILAVALAICATEAFSTVIANVRGVVHDPQHRPIAGAKATLRASTSDFELAANTNQDGLFEFSVVPLGEYTITVEARDFTRQTQSLTVVSGSAPVLHYQLAVGGATEKINVTAESADSTQDSPGRNTLISREEIARYAGVDSSTSFRIITQFVPGAYMVHDQLHVRGGHQVTWAIDGVPIPNTNIASNVGPQFNPKDIDYLEAQSGSYSAEYGDRTYGVFNVATRTGFEGNRQVELVTSYGNYNSTDRPVELRRSQ